MVQKLLDSGTGFLNTVINATKIKIVGPIVRYVVLAILLLMLLGIIWSYFKRFYRKTCEKNIWIGHAVAIVLVVLLAIFAAYIEESFKKWVIKNFIIVIGLVIMIISLPFLFSKPKQGEKKSKIPFIVLIIGLLIALVGAYLGYIDSSNGLLFYSKTERSDTLGTEQNEEKNIDNDGVGYNHELSIRGSKYIFNGEAYSDIEDVKAKLESSVKENDTVYLTDNYASVLCYKSAEKLLNEIKLEKHIEIKCKTSD